MNSLVVMSQTVKNKLILHTHATDSGLFGFSKLVKYDRTADRTSKHCGLMQ